MTKFKATIIIDKDGLITFEGKYAKEVLYWYEQKIKEAEEQGKELLLQSFIKNIENLANNR